MWGDIDSFNPIKNAKKVILHGDATDYRKACRDTSRNVEIATDNNKIKIENHNLLSKDNTVLYAVLNNNLSSLKIRDDVKKILLFKKNQEDIKMEC